MKKVQKIPEAPATAMQIPEPALRPIAELATEMKAVANWSGGVVHVISPDNNGHAGIEINTIRGSERAPLGSWIVQDAAGNFAVYEDYQFKKLFTPVEEEC